MRSLVIAVLFGLMLTACASTQRYEGPKRDASEIAVIEKAVGKWSGYSVIRVNDKLNGVFGWVKSFEVLPGETTMLLNYVPGNNYEYTAKVRFDAVAGKAYWLKTKLSSGYPASWLVWIEDKETGDTVSRMEKPY